MKQNRLTKLSIQLMIPVMALSVYLFGIKRTAQLFISRSRPSSENIDDETVFTLQLLRFFKHSRMSALWQGNCLSRSLALHWFLRNNGIASLIQIGIIKKPDFKAHAWVESQGRPLNARQDVRQRYTVVENLSQFKLNEFS